MPLAASHAQGRASNARTDKRMVFRDCLGNQRPIVILFAATCILQKSRVIALPIARRLFLTYHICATLHPKPLGDRPVLWLILKVSGTTKAMVLKA